MALATSAFILVLGCSFWLATKGFGDPPVISAEVRATARQVGYELQFATFKIDSTNHLVTAKTATINTPLANFVSAISNPDNCRYGLVMTKGAPSFDMAWVLYTPAECDVRDKTTYASNSMPVLKDLGMEPFVWDHHFCEDVQCLKDLFKSKDVLSSNILSMRPFTNFGMVQPIISAEVRATAMQVGDKLQFATFKIDSTNHLVTATTATINTPLANFVPAISGPGDCRYGLVMTKGAPTFDIAWVLYTPSGCGIHDKMTYASDSIPVLEALGMEPFAWDRYFCEDVQCLKDIKPKDVPSPNTLPMRPFTNFGMVQPIISAEVKATAMQVGDKLQFATFKIDSTNHLVTATTATINTPLANFVPAISGPGDCRYGLVMTKGAPSFDIAWVLYTPSGCGVQDKMTYASDSIPVLEALGMEPFAWDRYFCEDVQCLKDIKPNTLSMILTR